MRVPFTDIDVEYMDTPERSVIDLRPCGIKEVPVLGWCCYSHARPDLPEHRHAGVIEVHFKEEMGLSPGQFILRTRVDAACRRLGAGNDSIGQIAGGLGFPTSQYFATVFRRLMGVSPKTYRLEGESRGPSHRAEDGPA